jgi:hypothetical protein
MREPTPHAPAFGLLAEFNTPERLLEAAGRTRKDGYVQMDAYTPFPVEGLGEAIGFHENKVPLLTFWGGVLGAALGYGMQVYTNWAFPIDIGNRPLQAPPAFALITFELMVLFAVSFAVVGMLALNHLPRLHHPVFDVPSFHLASQDRFFLVILANDGKFDMEETRAFLERLGPVEVRTVEHTEEPE